MCSYLNLSNGVCNITNQSCPYTYFCNRTYTIQPSKNIPDNCKIKQNRECPIGYYKVCFERRGKLYVQVNEYVELIDNPYDFVPSFVKLTKLKNGNCKIKGNIV